MRAKLIYCSWLNVNGMALFPFILIKRKENFLNGQLIRHEKIHIKQQLELLIIPFYIIYLVHYFINLFIYLSHDKAYRNIVFEKEAYQNDKDATYLSNRKVWAFVNYL